MASGGIITEPMLLVDPRTGRTSGMIGETGPEAVVPIRRGGATVGSTGRGNTTNYLTIEKVVTDDPEALMDGLERFLQQTNRDGARVRILKALKLKQPGAF